MRSLLSLAALLVLVVAVGCGPQGLEGFDPALNDSSEYDVAGPFVEPDPLGKADSAGVAGPLVMTDTRATQVWTARNKWEDTDTTAARAAGMAWPANSGLTWDEKYSRWIADMDRSASTSYFDTMTFNTPWGKRIPAPKLECAEVPIFLRITFASWYQLPFYLTARDSNGTRIYFGHFGARTKTSRYGRTPEYANWYRDYSYMSTEQALANWPQDARLRDRGLRSGGDDNDFLFEGAKSGAYFDEIFLNKRVGYFLLLTLEYFGSMNLADSRNSYNVTPQSLRAGDFLLKRYRTNGVGHTLQVKQVTELGEGQLEAEVVSGSMPRRQPKWDDPAATKRYFTAEEGGGEGTNYDGEEYVKLGGGLKRWRVTKNINGYWTNTWMRADEASWISDTNYARLKVRPSQFETLLGELDPELKRQAIVQVIEDARNHLREYPASCSARTHREEAFAELYELNQREFDMSPAETDREFRILDDYVFAELVYEQSKTCCWNKSTSYMYQIIMDYNESLLTDSCSEPVVFMNRGGGYEIFAAYARETGRELQWKAWTEDESCPQRNVVDDTEQEHPWIPWCEASVRPE